MRKRFLLVMLAVCMVVVGGCSSDAKVNNSKDKTSSSDNSDEVSEEASEFEGLEPSFKASGVTTLNDFITNAKNLGYEVVKADTDETYVTSKVNVGEVSYVIKYLVSGENLNVSMVEVVASSKDEVKSEGYLNCVYALSRALKPDVDEAKLKEAVANALGGNTEQVVEGDMMFIFYSDDMSLAVFH